MRKENFVPIVIIAMAIAFVFVSVMVFLSNGNAQWVKRKLRVGGIILGFIAILNGCKHEEDIITCYLVGPPAPDNVYFSGQHNDTISVKLSQSLKLQGTLSGPTSKNYSFSISDSSNNSLYKDEIRADDSVFNEDYEYITLTLNKDIPTGTFSISFYKCKTNKQKNIDLIQKGVIKIEN